MAKMGLVAIYPRTSDPHPEHRFYPYLLRNLEITRPNHVRRADVTYLPMRRGFLYLVANMDWASRKVLAWRLSNTMDAGFCVEALKEALARFGKPDIFNADQGSQFTSNAFTGVPRAAEIKVSMGGRGRWMDILLIERLWRSLKYECVYLHAFETGSELRAGLGRWSAYYDNHRPHSHRAGKTPGEGIWANRRFKSWGHAPPGFDHTHGGMNDNQDEFIPIVIQLHQIGIQLLDGPRLFAEFFWTPPEARRSASRRKGRICGAAPDLEAGLNRIGSQIFANGVAG